jgi:predicted nucleic acid-binding Zn ribbon protein
MSCELCGAKIEGDITVCRSRYFGEVLNREYSYPDYVSVLF